MLTRIVAHVLPSVLALAGALIVSAVIIAASGGNPVVAFAALIDGAFGSLDSLSEVGVKACPLLLAGLAIAVSFQAGVWNIGAEGQLLMGALAMAALGTHGAQFPAWQALAVCELPLQCQQCFPGGTPGSCATGLHCAAARTRSARRPR